MKAQQTTAGPQEHDHTTTERDRIWGNSGQGQQHGRGQAGTRTRTTSVRAVDTGQLNRRTAKLIVKERQIRPGKSGKIDGESNYAAIIKFTGIEMKAVSTVVGRTSSRCWIRIRRRRRSRSNCGWGCHLARDMCQNKRQPQRDRDQSLLACCTSASTASWEWECC